MQKASQLTEQRIAQNKYVEQVHLQRIQEEQRSIQVLEDRLKYC